jgi:hypothetical protein
MQCAIVIFNTIFTVNSRVSILLFRLMCTYLIFNFLIEDVESKNAEDAAFHPHQRRSAGWAGRKGQVQYKSDSWYDWQKRPGTVQVRQLVWLAEKARYSTSQTAGMIGRKGQIQYKSDSWFG